MLFAGDCDIVSMVLLDVAVGPLNRGQLLLCPRKGGPPMVTYEALFAYTLVIIGIVALFMGQKKK